jgi:outer membrane receptor protein involved in Fe transport
MQVTGPVSLTASALVNYTQLAAAYAGYGAPVPSSVTLVPNLSTPDPYNPKQSDQVGYYKSPVIPWQFTWNGAVFYQFDSKYTITFSVYNITGQKNWQPSPGYYGNDFLVRSDPRTYEVRLQAKF